MHNNFIILMGETFKNYKKHYQRSFAKQDIKQFTTKHLFYVKVSLLTYEALSKTSNIQHRFHGEESRPSPFARKYLALLQ